jgi:broad specificity phosphatase PhoE
MITEAPRRIVAIRHSATEWSTAGRHTGRTDIALTPEGERQAAELRSRLERYDAALVFSSPLRRALDTCRLAGFADRVTTDRRLVEWDYGEYEGLRFAEIQGQRPGWKLFSDGCPGGESTADVARRAESFLRSIRGKPTLAQREVIVFSHGHFLRVLTACWLEVEPALGRLLELDSPGMGVLGWKRGESVLEHWNL